MDGGPAHNLVDFWRHLGNRATTYEQHTQILKLSKALSSYSDGIWNSLLLSLASNPRPVMLCYMCDGWSAWTWTVIRDWMKGTCVEEARLERMEYLLERGILRIASANGSSSAALRVTAPRPMLDGKCGWNIFQSLTEYHKPLRMYTTGPCMLFVCLDGAHLSTVEDLVKARRQLYYEHWRHQGDEDLHSESTDFVFFFHCVAHVFSLALKWGGSCHGVPKISSAMYILQ